ncbi:MAG: putative membrane-bound dehydrogenase-like protein [Verrucomicrobiales bacterium]|jgi:putative membrane-bound dehydrogenase-like protein
MKNIGHSLLPGAATLLFCLSASAQLEPEQALETLEVADGLELALFASEPTLVSPTNLDIDARGRVWVIEVTNYRGNRGTRPKGDRILILEDTDGDGVADNTKVFYQGQDIDSAMGIAVLGDRVIVTCSPNVIVFRDEDGDDKADPNQQLLFTNTGTNQSDHAAHSFVFGPDGKLYWNFGNAGHQVCDSSGKVVVDLAGNEVRDGGKPYHGGMVFRCDLDGKNLETLGHNFRNNYEVAVDSFGTIWQSDNDDDGNESVRLNYVMEFGNFGYRDEIDGGGWREWRSGQSSKIPERHWHQNDPGVVPNFVISGAGSPTGITVYEGELLPEIFRNQVIHCDAGPRKVRAFKATKEGAGYKGEMIDLINGEADPWFRPVDAAVAPDGSLFITDWYDPVVGGNGMGDLLRGRIYRLAPPGSDYEFPAVDTSTAKGAIEALQSPNIATRYLAWEAMGELGYQKELGTLLVHKNPRMRARGFWLMSALEGKATEAVALAGFDQDEDIRALSVRIARARGLDIVKVIRTLARDRSVVVRRECAIGLRFESGPEADKLWAKLALKHEGTDRWYLEALGIGADLSWDTRLAAWQSAAGETWHLGAGGREIAWRSRGSDSAALFAELALAADPARDPYERFVRAFHFLPDREAATAGLLEIFDSPDLALTFAAASDLSYEDLASDPKRIGRVSGLIRALDGKPELVRLVESLGISTADRNLLDFAMAKPDSPEAPRAIRLLDENQQLLRKQLYSSETKPATALIELMGKGGGKKTNQLLLAVVKDSTEKRELRLAAIRALLLNEPGADQLFAAGKGGNFPRDLAKEAVAAFQKSRFRQMAGEAPRTFGVEEPAAPGLPTIAELMRLEADPERGKAVFGKAVCASCHQIKGEFVNFGPDLSKIGVKLGKDALFDSILTPDRTISNGYEGAIVKLGTGESATGFIISETSESLTLKTPGGLDRKIATGEITSREPMKTSLMPGRLAETLSAQEISDLVAYLESLR